MIIHPFCHRQVSDEIGDYIKNQKALSLADISYAVQLLRSIQRGSKSHLKVIPAKKSYKT